MCCVTHRIQSNRVAASTTAVCSYRFGKQPAASVVKSRFLHRVTSDLVTEAGKSNISKCVVLGPAKQRGGMSSVREAVGELGQQPGTIVGVRGSTASDRINGCLDGTEKVVGIDVVIRR